MLFPYSGKPGKKFVPLPNNPQKSLSRRSPTRKLFAIFAPQHRKLLMKRPALAQIVRGGIGVTERNMYG